MHAHVLRRLVVATAVIVTLAAGAEPAPPCELPAADADPMTQREQLLAAYERLPQSCLRELFSVCSSESSRSLLDFNSAAVCSLGYEALLKQGFGGNFRALLAWWSSQRGRALQ